VRLATEQDVQLADGRTVHAVVGDWLITRGRMIIDVIGPALITERYQIVDGAERMLTAAVRTRLEQTLGLGATRNVDALIEAVERLAKIEIGEIRIEFTPGQLEEIKYRATKRGQTVPQALQAVIDRIKEEIFWRS
jgi:serine/threonine protein kinase HipA of HipAB toxin-antitoxin module